MASIGWKISHIIYDYLPQPDLTTGHSGRLYWRVSGTFKESTLLFLACEPHVLTFLPSQFYSIVNPVLRYKLTSSVFFILTEEADLLLARLSRPVEHDNQKVLLKKD